MLISINNVVFLLIVINNKVKLLVISKKKRSYEIEREKNRNRKETIFYLLRIRIKVLKGSARVNYFLPP